MAFTVRVVHPIALRILTPTSTTRAIKPVSRFPRGSIRSLSRTSLYEVKKYTDSHEWIDLADDGTATIGITKYAAKSLGDVVYVELPTADMEVNAGEPVGAVESVKSASDVISPVSGTVIEGNSILENKPKTINESAEEEGWIARIKVADSTELGSLMELEKYLETVGEK